MNIRNDNAGCVSEKHILNCGFTIFDTIKGNDMGQSSFELPQFQNSKCKIIGGYWNYVIKNLAGETILDGWWNSTDEFDQTIKKLNLC